MSPMSQPEVSRPATSAVGSRRTALHVLASAAAVALWDGRRRARAQSEDDVARQALEAIGQALATGDDGELDKLFAAEVAVMPRHRLAATGEAVSPGLTGLKATLADIRGIASSIELTVADSVADGDRAAGRFTFRAALGMATRPLEGSGLAFLNVGGDQVTELWIYPDPDSVVTLMPLATITSATATTPAP